MTLLATACASAGGRSNRALDLAEAERAFSRAAQTGTVHDAFVSVMHHDAVLFRPGPVNALGRLKSNPFPATLYLYWAPSFAEVSADGTLGVTYGPYVAGQRGLPPTGSGHFVTIWTKTEGDWKVAVDIGAQGPIPFSVDSAAHHLITRVGTHIYPFDESLRFIDDMLSANYDQRQASVAASDLRVFRDPQFPKTALGKFLRMELQIAPSGDLGYTFGTYTHGDRTHGWLRVYRRNEHRDWKLVVDII